MYGVTIQPQKGQLTRTYAATNGIQLAIIKANRAYFTAPYKCIIAEIRPHIYGGQTSYCAAIQTARIQKIPHGTRAEF